MRDVYGEVVASGFDLVADVYCECGEYLVPVNEDILTRCPGCGVGYLPVLLLMRYERNESKAGVNTRVKGVKLDD